jgi:hypothetical protein
MHKSAMMLTKNKDSGRRSEVAAEWTWNLTLLWRDGLLESSQNRPDLT